MAFWKPGQPNPPMKNLPGGGSSSNNNNNSNSNKNKNKSNKANNNKAKNVTESKIKLQNGSKVSMMTPAAANNSSAEAPVLSKSVMNMKFMQRKVEEESTQAARPSSSSSSANATGEDWFRTDRFVGSNTAAKKQIASSKLGDMEIVKVEDEVDMYAQLPGRRSFNGCNKAMERHYQQIIDDKYLTKQQLAAKQENNTVTITDEEMVERYQDLIGLPRGPSQGKRPASSLKQDRSEHRPKKHKK